MLGEGLALHWQRIYKVNYPYYNMVKKRVVGIPRSMTPKQRDELLIENFVGLQKAMVNLSMKFESLSDNISKLLHVFELAAKNVAEDGEMDSKQIARKLDGLLEQNKTIAQGLVLLESKINPGASQQSYSRPKPLPRI